MWTRETFLDSCVFSRFINVSLTLARQLSALIRDFMFDSWQGLEASDWSCDDCLPVFGIEVSATLIKVFLMTSV